MGNSNFWEYFLIALGVAILIFVIGRARYTQHKIQKRKDLLGEQRFGKKIPKQALETSEELPLLEGDRTYSEVIKDILFYEDNIEWLRTHLKLNFYQAAIVFVDLIPEPANVTKRYPIAVSYKGRILGYVADNRAKELFTYLLANKGGLRAKAKVSFGLTHEVLLDLADPLRLRPKAMLPVAPATGTTEKTDSNPETDN